MKCTRYVKYIAKANGDVTGWTRTHSKLLNNADEGFKLTFSAIRLVDGISMFCLLSRKIRPYRKVYDTCKWRRQVLLLQQSRSTIELQVGRCVGVCNSVHLVLQPEILSGNIQGLGPGAWTIYRYSQEYNF